MKSLLTLPIVLFIAASAFAQTTYTWNGSTSSAWNTATNWTPNGTPGALDNVRFTGAGLDPVLDQDRTVKRVYQSADTIHLGGHTLTVTGTFDVRGNLVDNGKVLQRGSTSDTTRFHTINMACKTDLESGKFIMTTVTFADSTRLSRIGNGTTSVTGGNKYLGHTELVQKDSNLFYFGNLLPDSFMTTLDIINMSKWQILMCYRSAGNYFGGDVRLMNLSTQPISRVMFFHNAYPGSSASFHGDISISATGGQYVAFLPEGEATIAAGSTIRIDTTIGYHADYLYLRNIRQLGEADLDLRGIGSVTDTYISHGSSIGGRVLSSGAKVFRMNDSQFLKDVIVTAGAIAANGSTFRGDADLTRTGLASGVGSGGNLFIGNLSYTCERNTAGATYWGYNHPDKILGNLTLTNKGAQQLCMAYNTDCAIGGNVTLRADSTAGIFMGVITGRLVTLFGPDMQTWTSLSANKALEVVYDVRVNKPSGQMLLPGELDISTSLHLLRGNIRTTGTGRVKLRDNATVSGASDSSFVEGPVLKVGNDAFTFPVGRNGRYRPIAMSAPGSTVAEFRGEYFEHSADADFPLSSRDTTLVGISSNEFWTLGRLASTNNVSVTLAWDSLTSCAMDTPITAVRVAGWDGTKWTDRGNGGTTGTIDHGTVVSTAAVSDFHAFTVGHGAEEMGCDECNTARFLSDKDTCVQTVLDGNSDYRWYSFEGGSNLLLTLEYSDTISPNSGLQFDIYTGCSSALFKTAYSGDQSNVYTDTTFYQGQRYYIRVSVADTSTRDVLLCIRGGGGSCPIPPACQYVSNGDFDMVPNANDVASNSVLTYCWYNVAGWVNNSVTSSDFFYPGIPVMFGTLVHPGWPRRSGLGMCGFGATASNQGNPNYREFVSQNVSLIGGRTYRVTFHILPLTIDGDSKLVGFRLLPGTVTNPVLANLNINTTADYAVLIPGNNSGPFNTAQAYIEVSGIVTVSTSGTYWLNIGFFHPPYTTNTPSGLGPYNRIDDVTMTEAIWITGHSVQCAGGQGITLNANGGTNYVWTSSNPSATPELSFPISGSTLEIDPYPSTPVTITLTGTTPDGCQNTHTIELNPIMGPEVTITGDDSYCPGDDLPILVADVSGGGGSYQYLWNTSATTSSITASGGTYTVTVTGNGCPTTSSPFTVTQGAPAPAIIFDIDHVTCSGDADGAVAVSFDPPPSGLTWTWDPAVQGTNVPSITGQSGGLYEVTVTNADGCTNSATAQVNELGPISATLSNAPYCPNRGVWLTSLQDAVLPVTLDWQPAQYLQDNTALFAEIDHGNPPPGPSQTFTLTVTDDNGCTGQFQTNIGIGDCCFGPVTYDELQQPTDHTTHNGVNDQASDWGATLSPTALGVNEFAINGTFTVDEDLTIEDMDIILGPMAQIVIAPNKELTVTNSHLYPCSSFWHRVEAGAGAALVIEDGSILEQAYTAVHAHDGGTFHITNSTFDRNLIHISVHDYATTPNPAVISGNDLVCTQPLTGSGLYDRTYHGIWARNVPFLHLGFPEGNHFEHARFGIRAVNTGLHVELSTFEDMQMLDPGSGNLHFSGYGIHAVGTPQLDITVNRLNTFSNSSRGVAAYLFGTVEVNNNTFDNLTITNEAAPADENYGFGILSVASQSVDVNLNVLTDCELGIQAVQYSGLAHIYSNRIGQDAQNTYDRGVGIAVSGQGSAMVEDHREDENLSFVGHINDMRIGVLAQGLPSVGIFANEIAVNTAGSLYTAGIHAVNCHSPRIRYNTVVSDNDGLNLGIVTQGCAHPAVQCNTLDGPLAGILRTGETGAYTQTANIFTGVEQLVSLWAFNSTFPQQGLPTIPADNKWDIDTQFGYHTYNTSPASIPGRIYVRPHADNPASDEDLTYSPEPFEVGSNLTSAFFVLSQDASTSYTPNSDCDWWNSGMMGLVHGIALDTLSFTGDTVRIQKLAKWSLFRAALADSILAADSIVATFVDSMRQTNVAMLDSIHSQLFFGITAGKVDGLISLLNNISPQDSIESLFVEVIEHTADLFADPDTLPNGSVMAALEAIAQLCPLEHGPSIYVAREALAIADNRPRLFINDCETLYAPQPPGQRLAQPEDETDLDGMEQYSIYPNPANSLVTVLTTEWPVTFVLRDISGRECLRKLLVSARTVVDLGQLQQGVYVFVLMDGQASIRHRQQLVILK
jgi:hypothetical protein